jgi:hypothetical protein
LRKAQAELFQSAGDTLSSNKFFMSLAGKLLPSKIALPVSQWKCKM